MQKTLYYFFLWLTIPLPIFAGEATDTVVAKQTKIVASRITSGIIMDGLLNESEWDKAQKVTEFLQRDPDQGKTPSHPTEVRILYDNEALYIGAMLYDSSPDSIIGRLGRRDSYSSSDKFYVFLDPYRDKQTGYYFWVNAAGSIGDGVLFNDDWDDDVWDGVWEATTTLLHNGWSVEMKIPFSQVRFNKQEKYTWGINLKRDIARRNERDYIVYTPRNGSGFVSRFVELHGLENLDPGKSLEVLPYLTTKAEYLKHAPGDPFNDGSVYTPGIGADIKYALSSSLTLNASINPDFGQVEIDPAVINLSDVETFFDEKRPFFIEGSSVYNFGQGGARNYWNFNFPFTRFFYSRRIGRNPQGSVPTADYARLPLGTHIIGAAKMTGKIGDGIDLGTISAVTSSEKAELQSNGKRSEAEIEPMTYYGVLRMKKEFNNSAQAIGFMANFTNRFFAEERLKNEINKNAFTFGVDGWSFLDSSKTWVFTGWMGVSHITGTKERITAVQRNSTHYFQRPDAKSYSVDSSANSLTGYAMRFYVNKQKGNWFLNSSFGMISPRFDVNDMGFLSRADYINAHIGSGYSFSEPTDWYRFAELGGAVFRSYNYDGDKIADGIFHFGYFELLNYYSINWNLGYNPETVNMRRTRGGPNSINPASFNYSFTLQSDNRNPIVLYGGYSKWKNKLENNNYYWTQIEWIPADNVSFSISPEFDNSTDEAQFIGSFSDLTANATYGKRYTFARIHLRTFSAGVRLNWTFTPALSIQLYMQPLISTGKYTEYKELSQAGTANYLTYGTNGSTYNAETNTADPDGSGPAPAISFGNPDFNYRSLRGNAVLRWEYNPGSVLYFVWTQNREDFENEGEYRFNRSLKRLVETTPENIFILKFTYWFNY